MLGSGCIPGVSTPTGSLSHLSVGSPTDLTTHRTESSTFQNVSSREKTSADPAAEAHGGAAEAGGGDQQDQRESGELVSRSSLNIPTLKTNHRQARISRNTAQTITMRISS